MQISKHWPPTGLECGSLESAIGRFLRTHRQGYQLLREFVASEPADRTEAEFDEERKQKAAEYEAAKQRVRASMIARGLAGLPLIDEALLLAPTSD